mmetsp:Transcript_76697/g.193610  ORF Transcript_76697/g.193610 Transcript_76697/m.193610 type:complete len:260 (+) Transcript_76697:235-1014(+)
MGELLPARRASRRPADPRLQRPGALFPLAHKPTGSFINRDTRRNVDRAAVATAEAEAEDDESFACACRSAGIEVAVRAWWHGSRGISIGQRAEAIRAADPTRKKPMWAATRGEETWLRDAAIAAGTRGSKETLVLGGIPKTIIEAGVNFGSFLEDDDLTHEFWQKSQQQSEKVADFLADLVRHVFSRFEVHCRACNAPPLVVAPRPQPQHATTRPISAAAPSVMRGIVGCRERQQSIGRPASAMSTSAGRRRMRQQHHR